MGTGTRALVGFSRYFMIPEGARKKGRNRGAGKAPGREEWKDGGDMYISYMKTKREAGVPEKTESGKERIQMCRVCRREIGRAHV